MQENEKRFIEDVEFSSKMDASLHYYMEYWNSIKSSVEDIKNARVDEENKLESIVNLINEMERIVINGVQTQLTSYRIRGIKPPPSSHIDLPTDSFSQYVETTEKINSLWKQCLEEKIITQEEYYSIRNITIEHSNNDATELPHQKNRKVIPKTSTSNSNAIHPQLDENTLFTQPKSKIKLTPEQILKRKKIIEKLIANYRKMEHDNWYQERKEQEEKDMRRVVRYVNKPDASFISIKGPGIFRILIAAQNLSLKGGTDFLGEILRQPDVNDALLELRDSGRAHEIAVEASDNESKGRVNSDGLVGNHKLTRGETNIKIANSCIEKHPKAIERARELLGKEKTFKIPKGDNDKMVKARVIEILAVTQRKSASINTDKNGNSILEVSDSGVQLTENLKV